MEDLNDILSRLREKPPLMRKVRWWFKRMSQRFGRFRAYIPVIWRDEDYDYEGLYDLMQIKLQRLCTAIKSEERHEDTDETVRQIEEALEALEEVLDPDFMDPHVTYEEKTGIRPFTEFREVEGQEVGSEFVEVEIYHEPEDFGEYYSENIQLQDEAKEEARYRFFQIIANNLHGWWS